jgi:putative transposase
MEHYRRTAHTRFDIKFHLVWITKYRKRLLLVASSGNVTDEVIMEYIRTQGQEKADDDFRVDESS